MVIEGSYPQGAYPTYDLVVVGSGIAAQSLLSSRRLRGLRVAVVESGCLEPDPWTQSLRKLESIGLDISIDSRERYLGGTSNTWQKTCVPLDLIDLRTKPWVPLSGWPIEMPELQEFYDQAAEYLQIPRIHEARKVLERWPTNPWLANNILSGTLALDTNRANGFPPGLLDYFGGSMDSDLYLGSNLAALLPNESFTEVGALSLRTQRGEETKLSAKRFVLACGGIENPRILLLSRKAGFLDHLPVLGRCFMEHPKGEYGRIILNQPLSDIKPFEVFRSSGYRYGFGLRLDEKIQQRQGLLNCCVRLLPRPHLGFPKRPIRALAVKNFLEMAPRLENRVELSQERDQLGLRRGKVVCKLDSLAKKSLSVLHQHLASHLVHQGIGRLEGNLSSRDEWPPMKDASHHMGATRMGRDPSVSVVDPDCRVHGVNNLYIAGSSVFPSSGHSNPSYTIIALCLRLAQHLSEISE